MGRIEITPHAPFTPEPWPRPSAPSITYLAIKCGPWPDDCPTEEDGIAWCLKRWVGKPPQYVNIWPYGDPVLGETQVIVFRYHEGKAT